MPKIQEIVNTLGGMKYFTLIDLENEFFHVKIREEDKEKTAFMAGNRLMQCKRMPQGYKNSSAIFQHAMELILTGLVGEKCLVYVDDILVFGRDMKEHDDNLKAVEERLKEYNLKQNFAKRITRSEKVKFLGYEITYNSLKPCLDRAQGIKNYGMPKTKKKLQRFLGLINYDRNFIKNLSEKLKPLYTLLKKDNKFVWTAEAETN